MQDYCSPFVGWHGKSSVRSMPAADWLTGRAGAWMTKEQDHILAHPEVAPHQEEVSAGLLLASLSFTVALESRLIAPVALDIVARALRATYPDAVVADALRVQCDEAYHAVLAAELIDQVQRQSAAQAYQGEHPFLVRVDELVATFPTDEAAIVRFCAAAVAETLVTKALRDDWLGDSLQEDVRNFLRHHYRDEVRHSAFFSQLLQLLWPQWPDSVHRALRPVWQGFVDTFLGADDAATVAVLKNAGLSAERATAVTAECSRAGGGRRRRAACVQMTFHALRRAGALVDPDAPVTGKGGFAP